MIAGLAAGSPRRKLLGYIPAMAAVLFMLPFGWIQEVVLVEKLTSAKIVIPVLFFMLLFIRRGRVTIHPHLPIYILFIISTTPSLINGIGYEGILLSLVGYIALFFVVYNSINTIQDLRSLLLAYLLGLSLISVLVIFAYLTGIDVGATIGQPFVEYWYGQTILLGTALNPNGFATFFVVGIPIAFLFYLTASRLSNKLLCMVVFLVLWFTLLLTYSRSGIIGALLGCICLSHCRENRLIFTWKLIGKFILFLFFTLGFSQLYFLFLDLGSSDGVQALGISSNKEASQEARLQMLKFFLPIIAENPVIGIGHGNLPDLMEKAIGLHNNAHNIFFGLAIEYGLVALILFCTVLFVSMKATTKAINKANFPMERLSFGCVFAVVIGLIFHGLFHEIIINMSLWFFITLGGVLHHILNDAKIGARSKSNEI